MVAAAGRSGCSSPADAIAAGIGLAPEDRKSQALLLHAQRQATISRSPCPTSRRFDFVDPRRRAANRELSSSIGCASRRRASTQLVSNLSGGNQQKVVLGRWLARRPQVLILDEPTRGIDVGAKAEIYRLIAELAGEGIALLVISSEMPELLGLSDRILVMAGGRDRGRRARRAKRRTRSASSISRWRENLTRTEAAGA